MECILHLQCVNVQGWPQWGHGEVIGAGTYG